MTQKRRREGERERGGLVATLPIKEGGGGGNERRNSEAADEGQTICL